MEPKSLKQEPPTVDGARAPRGRTGGWVLGGALVLVVAAGCAPETPETPDTVRALYLGDDGHHQPWQLGRRLLPEFARSGIELSYTDDPGELTAEVLENYHVLMLYNNHPELGRSQLRALLDFVEGGGGLVAIHSASAAFQNSEPYIRLVGGAFKSHGVGTVATTRTEHDHPAIQDVPEFESWDETYVHQKMNPDVTVLSVREDEGREEPWTWVRKQGEGRIFYTAWGHDERTWSEPGFQRLLGQGTRWAAGDWALELERSEPDLAIKPLDTPIPYYPEGEPWATTGDPVTEAQEPLDPEASQRLKSLPPGFSLEHFASEPDIVNPMDMAWDEAGRLWILQSVDYPNEIHEDGYGNDQLLVLEDRSGDGRADEVTVFADSLNIPTGLAFWDDGVIVTQAPHTLYLKDTTGDGRADVRETLFTGWRTFDTHAGPSNLRYGLDNRIWGSVGYAGFEGTVGEADHDFRQGFFRFEPDGSDLERLGRTTNNTWGLGFTEEGYAFGSTANRMPSVFVPIPEADYETVEGWLAPPLPPITNHAYFFPLRDDIRQVDQHGQYTAGAGHEIYTARAFPREYWNRAAFVADPTGHLLGRFFLERDGSDFVARNRWNMVASRDGWSAPIASRVGPDGALWVIDWYNLIAQHNPTPEGFEQGEGAAYETPLRDRGHGRIYRIVPKDADLDRSFSLEGASPDELVDALRHPNMFWRLTAQRLLVERGEADVAPRLLELVADQTLDELELNPGALHAVWTLHGLGLLEEDEEALQAVREALRHPSHGVRRAAVQALPRREGLLDDLFDAGILPERVEPAAGEYVVPPQLRMDQDPHVRIEALLALAELPASERAAHAAVDLLVVGANLEDRWIPDAAAIAGAQQEPYFTADLANRIAEEGEALSDLGRAEEVLEIVERHSEALANEEAPARDPM